MGASLPPHDRADIDASIGTVHAVIGKMRLQRRGRLATDYHSSRGIGEGVEACH